MPQQTKDELVPSKLIDFLTTFLPKHKSEILTSIQANHFSRDRKLTLPIVLALLINMVRPGRRTGYQNVINRFFNDLRLNNGELPSASPPDKAAFLKARKKLPLDVFHCLYAKAVKMATELAGRFESLRWRGFRVLAVDGTRKNLPRSDELVAYFGTPSGSSRPQLLNLTLYDVMAKIPLTGVAAPNATSERALAQVLLDQVGRGDLLLLDRGFPGFRLFDEIKKTGADFLVRLPVDGLFTVVKSFIESGGQDGVVTIKPSSAVLREYREEGLASPEPLSLRIVKIQLSTGDYALYATTLLDSDRYSLEDLRDLYHLRWEEDIDHFVCICKGHVLRLVSSLFSFRSVLVEHTTRLSIFLLRDSNVF